VRLADRRKGQKSPLSGRVVHLSSLEDGRVQASYLSVWPSAGCSSHNITLQATQSIVANVVRYHILVALCGVSEVMPRTALNGTGKFRGRLGEKLQGFVYLLSLDRLT